MANLVKQRITTMETNNAGRSQSCTTLQDVLPLHYFDMLFLSCFSSCDVIHVIKVTNLNLGSHDSTLLFSLFSLGNGTRLLTYFLRTIWSTNEQRELFYFDRNRGLTLFLLRTCNSLLYQDISRLFKAAPRFREMQINELWSWNSSYKILQCYLQQLQ